MTALLTVPEVAARFGITNYQVRSEHTRGILPGRRVGRFLRFAEADLTTYLERIAEDNGGNRSGLTTQSRNRRRRTA